MSSPAPAAPSSATRKLTRSELERLPKNVLKSFMMQLKLKVSKPGTGTYKEKSAMIDELLQDGVSVPVQTQQANVVSLQ